MTLSHSGAKGLALVFWMVLVAILTACGGGSGSSSTNEPSTAGSAALSLDLQFLSEKNSDQRINVLSNAFAPDVCQDYLIDTVEFKVYKNSGTELVKIGNFSCISHGGTIPDLPCNTDLSVSITGYVAEQPDWFSQVDNIILGDGEARNLAVVLNYVGNDHTPPSIVGVQPIEAATGIATDNIICAVFNERLAPSSITDQTITVQAADMPLEGELTYDHLRNAICFTPAVQFEAATLYDARLQGLLSDTAVNSIDFDHAWQFTTTSGSDDPTYTITAFAGSGGSISPSGSISVDYGSDQTYEITPLDGYVISELLVNGSAVPAATTYTFSNVTADATIQAIFSTVPYSLFVSKNGTGGGTVSSAPAGIDCGDQCVSQYAADTAVTLTASADAGSSFSGWSGGGCSGSDTCQVTMDAPVAVTVTAAFTLNTYTITATAGTGGSITPAGDTTVNHGAGQVYQITPDSGYYLSELILDCCAVAPTSIYSFSNVTQNHTIEAKFTAIEQDIVFVNAGIEVSGDGQSWVSAVKTVQEAVGIVANGGEIWVKMDDYKVTAPIIIDKAVRIYGGFNGTESDVSQRAYTDKWTNQTNISSDANSRIFEVSGANVVFDGLDIENGSASFGAGIYLEGGSLEIRHSVFYANNASDSANGGGGIYASAGSVVLIDTAFESNTSAGTAAGVYLDHTSAVMEDCEFHLNDSASGGAAVDSFDSALEILNTYFIENSSTSKTGATLRVNNTTMTSISNAWFNDNDSCGVKVSGGTASIVNSLFFRNTGFDLGGAVDVGLNSNVTVVNCTLLEQESVAAAGAIQGPAAVWNSILWDNLSTNGPNELSNDVNLYYSNVNQFGYAGSNGNISQSPMLVDPDNSNFHLQSNSPCIDAGGNESPYLPAYDFEGDTRFLGPAVDMGRDETLSAPIAGVVVYEHINYGGYWAILGVGDYTLASLNSLGIQNDAITSLKVGDGFKITLFEHNDFGGLSLVRTVDDTWLEASGWNDRVSSIRVESN